MSSKFPVPAFNFRVKINNMQLRFSEVNGIKVTTEFKDVKSGGENNMVYKIPMRTTCGEVTLKRGVFRIGEGEEMSTYDFISNIRDINNFETPGMIGDGSVRIKDITVTLLDEAKKPIASWQLVKPSIVSYELSTLNASSNEIAFETLTVAPAGIKVLST